MGKYNNVTNYQEGAGIPKVQNPLNPLENPLNPVKVSVKKDALYDSAAEIKGEVRKITLH